MIDCIYYKMLDDIAHHKRDKDTFIQEQVTERLNKSFDAYYEDLSKCTQYLQRRQTKSVTKRLSK